MFRLEVLDSAASEADEIVKWYDEQRTGYGERFQLELSKTFQKIQSQPKRFLVVEKSVRRALVTKFPYVVYFQLRDNEIFVLTVIHSSRRPYIWRSRILGDEASENDGEIEPPRTT
jgi:toxin ParE1/3/4